MGDGKGRVVLIKRRPPIIRPRNTRLAIFIFDAAHRSVWGCPQALTRYAIQRANDALLKGFQ